MDPSTKNRLRTLLDRRIAEVEQSVAEYTLATQPIAPENSIGRISRMDAIQNKSVTEAALWESRQQLKRLERARLNFEKDTYGICAKCGVEIPIGRLELMPEATRCVNCAV